METCLKICLQGPLLGCKHIIFFPLSSAGTSECSLLRPEFVKSLLATRQEHGAACSCWKSVSLCDPAGHCSAQRCPQVQDSPSSSAGKQGACCGQGARGGHPQLSICGVWSLPLSTRRLSGPRSSPPSTGKSKEPGHGRLPGYFTF